MELEYYGPEQENNKELISQIKLLDDKAFGTGPNIVGITKEEIKNILHNGFILAITSHKKIISEIMIEYKQDHWYAGGIATDPEYFRKGLGDRLMKEVIRRAGNNTIKATVREDNIQSIGLCLNKNGFLITKFDKDHFGPGKDRLIIELGPHTRKYQFLEQTKESSCKDKEHIRKILEEGYVGTKISQKEDGYYLTFTKKKN